MPCRMGDFASHALHEFLDGLDAQGIVLVMVEEAVDVFRGL